MLPAGSRWTHIPRPSLLRSGGLRAVSFAFWRFTSLSRAHPGLDNGQSISMMKSVLKSAGRCVLH